MKTIYVVTMYRFGDMEKHSYVQGVFTKKAQAQKAGIAEEYYRGGKYIADIYEVVIDKHDEDSIKYWKESCGMRK